MFMLALFSLQCYYVECGDDSNFYATSEHRPGSGGVIVVVPLMLTLVIVRVPPSIFGWLLRRVGVNLAKRYQDVSAHLNI